MKLLKVLILAALLPLFTVNAFAQLVEPQSGPVFHKFGKTVPVETDVKIPEGTVLKVVYDSYKNSEVGKMTSTFNSAASFINMHVRAGVPQENLKVAIVVHGSTSMEVTKQEFYGAKNNGIKNANIEIVKALLKEGVEIYICGQSANYRGISKNDLIPGVKMSLSALTAHAMLQKEGYSLILW